MLNCRPKAQNEAENRKQVLADATLVNVVYADGSKASFRQNPRIWKNTPQTATIQINSPQKLKSLTLDGGIFMDFNPADNTWKSR